MSSGGNSLGMAASLMEGAGQDALDAVNLGGDVARRQAGDLTDGRRVHTLQIREDDLAIQRLQSVHQRKKAAERLLAAGVRRRRAWHLVQLFQAEQEIGFSAPLPHGVGRGGVVGHAIDPGAQRAARVPARETAPQRQVDLLEQVAAMVRVRLVGSGEPFQGGAVSFGGFAVPFVLCRSFHNQGSPSRRRFLTDNLQCSWFLSRNCREKQTLPDGRGSDGLVDTARLPIRAATVRERSYAWSPSFATETSYTMRSAGGAAWKNRHAIWRWIRIAASSCCS